MVCFFFSFIFKLKILGFYPEEVDQNTSSTNYPHSSPSNRNNILLNTWVDSNMTHDSYTYPQSQPQSNFSSTQNLPTKSPFRQNRDSVQHVEERPRSVSRRQTPTLSQNTSYYQAPPTLTSSPMSNLNKTQDNNRSMLGQNPQAGVQYLTAHPQFNGTASSTQNQYPPQPINPAYQPNMGYPNPNQPFQYPNLVPLQYGHPINPQINPHSPHVPAGYVMPPPLVQTINPAGYSGAPVYPSQPHYVQSGIGQPVYTSPAPVTDQGYVYYPTYSTLPTQPNVPGVAGYPTINTGQQTIMVNPSSMSSTPNARYAKPPTIPAGGKEDGGYQQKKETIEDPIKNYIKEQEEFLKKLENDKKQAAERRKAAATPQNVVPHVIPKSAVLDSNTTHDYNKNSAVSNQVKQVDSTRENPAKGWTKTPQKYVIEDKVQEKPVVESEKSPNRAKPRIFERKGSQELDIPEKDFNVQTKPRTPVREAPRNQNFVQEKV